MDCSDDLHGLLRAWVVLFSFGFLKVTCIALMADAGVDALSANDVLPRNLSMRSIVFESTPTPT